MGLQHLSDSDLEALSTRGLVGVSDEGLHELSLPEDYGRTTPTPQPGVYPDTIKEEGLIPQGPVSSVTGPIAGLLGKASEAVAKSPLGGTALAPLGIGLQVGSELLPKSEPEAAAQYFLGKVPLEGLGQATKLPAAGKEAQTLAQSYRSLGAIPERTTQSVLKRIEEGVNPLTKAKPLEEATADYVKTIPGLKNVTESLHEALGKSVPTLGDYGNFLDETLAKAKAGTAEPQDILNGIQATNKILGHKEFAKDPDIVRGLIERKNNLIDLLDKAYPDFKDANQALRDAHLKNEFDTFFPRNKNMSVNQLRGFLTMASNIATGTGALMTGNPVPLAGSMALTAAQSPKVLGGLLSARAALGQDITLPSLTGMASKAAEGTGKSFTGAASKAIEGTSKSLAKIMKSESGAIFPKGALEDMVKKPIMILKEKIEAMPQAALEKRVNEISDMINKAGEATVKATQEFGKDSPQALRAATASHDLINKLMPEWTLGREHLKNLAKQAAAK